MVERARVQLAPVRERECVFRLSVLRYTTAPNGLRFGIKPSEKLPAPTPLFRSGPA
jgi:hypothetical protein